MLDPATATQQEQQEDTQENPDSPTPADRRESETQGSEPADRPGQIPKPKIVVTAPFQAAEDPYQTQFTVKGGDWKRCLRLLYNSHRRDVQPLQPNSVVHSPWSKLAIDIVGPLTTTRAGHKYLLTIVDLATRFPEAVPLKKVDAASTPEALLTVFSSYGIPQQLVHDNGGNFTAKFTELVMKALGISQIRTAPYHPEANGLIERLNGTIKKALKKAGAEGKKWDKLLPLILYAIRITSHSSTGHSPYYLMFGRHPYTPTSSIREAIEGDWEDIPQPVSDYLYL